MKLLEILPYCAHRILQIEPLIITDAQQDRRFANNPLLIGAPYIRFYAGVPLIDADGFALGILCVIDYVPRQLSNQQMTLEQIASIGACR